ncbi:MAG: PD-(D/E)XK nuclease family protein [Deltaproteobacteria bacterium]|nr:PD-(D/E)XK nuclease family protein [Deltaproteobacteria bacterium]
MRITFGMYLDGVPWSEKEASSGEIQVGPLGLLSVLETRLGLTGPEVHPAVRIDQYMHRMELQDHPDKWFHSSFNADAWSTAKQMLAWRDGLVAAGWRGETDESMSPRLQALAELEKTDFPLAMGQEDRLREVLRHLKDISSISFSLIYLQEDFDLLPPVWKKMFKQLQGFGVPIHPLPAIRNRKKSPSNLASVQKILSDNTNTTSIKENDDSLLLVKASNEWEAAETLALWLAAEQNNNQEVIIICGSDTDVMDQTLERHGLPQAGNTQSTQWRGSLQVLPMVLANAWKPVDVNKLVELLSSPIAPIPGYAARHLLRALSKEPGVGGDAWNKALETIADEYKKRAYNKSADRKKTPAQFAGELDSFLARDRYYHDSGIPEEKLKERCQWVIEWLAWRIDKDPFLAEAVSHCREMQKLAEGKGDIPRVAVERMLDSVIGVGGTAPDRFEQAAPWQVVRHPGQMTKSCKTVIWWDFTDPLARSSVYWNTSEQDALFKMGIELEDSRTFRNREAVAWMRGFQYAEDHFLMFYPGSIYGEAVYHHPFWDEIRNGAAKVQPDMQDDAIDACLTRECKDLQDKGRWKLAGRSIKLQKVKFRALKTVSASYEIPEDSISMSASISYSQMSTMIACPMKWILQYHAGLSLPNMQIVPSGNQMIGTFCHRIVQKLYSEPGKAWTPEKAETRAGELYDSLVGSMATELLLEGNELENMRYRHAIRTAVRELVSAVSRLDLTVGRSEERLEGNLDGIPFTGYADLLLRDKNGNPFVLDMKWSGSSRYRKEEVEQGEALQLATYSWLLKSAKPGSRVHSAYFMLAQGELLSDSDLLQDEALTSKYTQEEIWEMGVNSWNQCMKDLRRGRVEAGGVKLRLIEESEGLKEDRIKENLKSECIAKGMLYQGPQCGFCDFGVLCGMKGAAS